MAHRRQSSANEAEFRAYLIYLNLNDTKKALKHLGAVPSHLKTDPFIVRVRNVLNAYIAENYSKFFRVVRQATQLEGSVLFRYFNKERFQVVFSGLSTNQKEAISRKLIKDERFSIDNDCEILQKYSIFHSGQFHFR